MDFPARPLPFLAKRQYHERNEEGNRHVRLAKQQEKKNGLGFHDRRRARGALERALGSGGADDTAHSGDMDGSDAGERLSS